MFDRGVYSENDIRKAEGENPVEGGDRRYVPMNMVPVDLVDSIFKPGKSTQESDAVDAMAAVRMACKRFFRDATGRVLNRKPAERQKYAESAFLQPVLAVFECILGKIPADLEELPGKHARRLALDSASWAVENADLTASELLEETIEAVLAKTKAGARLDLNAD